jgi:hypothetical protein
MVRRNKRQNRGLAPDRHHSVPAPAAFSFDNGPGRRFFSQKTDHRQALFLWALLVCKVTDELAKLIERCEEALREKARMARESGSQDAEKWETEIDWWNRIQFSMPTHKAFSITARNGADIRIQFELTEAGEVTIDSQSLPADVRSIPQFTRMPKDEVEAKSMVSEKVGTIVWLIADHVAPVDEITERIRQEAERDRNQGRGP